MNENINNIASLLASARKAVVVTGAGISTEAGIPDFRGENGIYRKLGENRVLNIINIDFFRKHPDQFYAFFRENLTFPNVEPSKAHYMLAEMEKRGVIKGIVTQNIDGLHNKAGSKKVIPIHGTADRFVCTGSGCNKVYDYDYVLNHPDIVPSCSECGNILKPDVVLFGENIHNYIDASEMILSADVLLVIGSSLTVYPLAGMVKEFSTITQNLIIINKGYTQLDHAAVVKLDTGKTGDALEAINALI